MPDARARPLHWSPLSDGGWGSELSCGHRYELHGQIPHRREGPTHVNEETRPEHFIYYPILPDSVICGVCQQDAEK
jgi:hypothetical protein